MAGAGSAAAASDPVYVNVASGENKGCSDDDADFIVNVFHEGEKVAKIPEITHHDSPLWGAVEQLDGVQHGDTLAFQIREGESSLFDHWRETCDLSSGDGKRSKLTWDGTQQHVEFEGDGGDAALLRVTVGPDRPPMPQVRLAERDPDSLELAWDRPEVEADGYVVREAWANDEVAKLPGNATGYHWEGLKDNEKHKVQVIRNIGPWQAGAIETFRTANAAPPQPNIVEIVKNDGEVAITWRKANLHDGKRLEIHAGASPDFEPTNETLRAEDDYQQRWHDDHPGKKTTGGVALQNGDEYLKLRAVDTKGAANVSEAVRLLGPPQIEDVYESDEGLTVRWTHHRSTLERFEIHTGSEPGFELSSSTERARVEDPGGEGRWGRTGISVRGGHDYVVVRAVDQDGNTTTSSPAEIVEDPPPPTPWDLAATQGGSEVTVMWTAELPDDVARAEVLAGDEPAIASMTVRTNASDLDLDRKEHSTLATDVAVGDHVAVRLVDERGQTATSSTVRVEDELAPPAPEIRQALATEGNLSLAWRHQTPKDLARYEVYGLAEANATPTEGARVAVINDWPDRQPMTVEGLQRPAGADHVVLAAVDDSGNTARSQPAPIEAPGEALPAPSSSGRSRPTRGSRSPGGCPDRDRSRPSASTQLRAPPLGLTISRNAATGSRRPRPPTTSGPSGRARTATATRSSKRSAQREARCPPPPPSRPGSRRRRPTQVICVRATSTRPATRANRSRPRISTGRRARGNRRSRARRRTRCSVG